MYTYPPFHLEPHLSRLCLYDMEMTNPSYGQIHRFLNEYPCIDGVLFTVSNPDSILAIPPLFPFAYDLIHVSDPDVIVCVDDFVLDNRMSWISIASLNLSAVSLKRKRTGPLVFRAIVLQLPERVKLRYAVSIHSRDLIYRQGRLRYVMPPSEAYFFEDDDDEKIILCTEE